MKKNLLVFFTFCYVAITAQQIPLSALYGYNKMLINPATTGMEEATLFHAATRQQWLGFEGAPVTAWLTGQTQLSEKMGVGGVVILDKMAFLERLNVRLHYAYGLKINDEHKVRFGLGLGMLQAKINSSNVLADDMNDALLVSPSMNGITLDAQFGFVYSFKSNLEAGFSFPQLLQNKISLSNDVQSDFILARHMKFFTSYNLEINEDFTLKPILMLRSANFKNSQMDFFANIAYQEKFWGGVGFRQYGGMLLNVGGKIKEMFGLTYSYELGRSGVANNTAGSHELMLSFQLGKKQKEEQEPEQEIAPIEPTDVEEEE